MQYRVEFASQRLGTVFAFFESKCHNQPDPPLCYTGSLYVLIVHEVEKVLLCTLSA